MAFTQVNVSKQRLVLVQGNNCANPPEECSPAHDKIQDKKCSSLRCFRRRMVFGAGNTSSVFTSTRCVKNVVDDTTGGLVSSKVADIPYEAKYHGFYTKPKNAAAFLQKGSYLSIQSSRQAANVFWLF